MQKKTREKTLPKEFAEAKILLNYPVVQAYPFDLPHEIQPILREFVPDTHTAQFNYEIYKSLVLNWEVTLPAAAGDFIDKGDKIKLIAKVSNNYEVQTGPIFLLKRVPKVWFKDVVLCMQPTDYARVLNGNIYGLYPLVTGTDRLKPGDTRTKEFDLEIIKGPPYDGNWNIACLKVTGNLDYERFFKDYIHAATANAYIRAP